MSSRTPKAERPAPRSAAYAAPRQIRVLMLEDSEIDAELIRHEMRRGGLAAVTTRVDSAEAFSAALRTFAPDVVLSDHSLAQFDGRAALAVVRRIRPATPLIVVTGFPNTDQTAAYIRAGAEDLITKTDLSRLASSIMEAVRLRRPLEKLTSRQIEVLRMVAEGHRTREIADRLKLSAKTVESHRGEVMKRLEIHDVVGLVLYAVRVGLVAVAA